MHFPISPISSILPLLRFLSLSLSLTLSLSLSLSLYLSLSLSLSLSHSLSLTLSLPLSLSISLSLSLSLSLASVDHLYSFSSTVLLFLNSFSRAVLISLFLIFSLTLFDHSLSPDLSYSLLPSLRRSLSLSLNLSLKTFFLFISFRLSIFLPKSSSFLSLSP